QYREMQVFSQFGSDLDEQTTKQLKYGAGLMQLLKQPNQAPLSLAEQVILLICAQNKLFLDTEPAQIPAVKRDLLDWFKREQASLCLKIESDRKYSDELKAQILEAAEKYMRIKA
nr:F0F1 ATP synthase subunit alpha [Lachnospiraceae bacterium]